MAGTGKAISKTNPIIPVTVKSDRVEKQPVGSYEVVRVRFPYIEETGASPVAMPKRGSFNEVSPACVF